MLIVFIAGLLTGAILVAAGAVLADRFGRLATGNAPDAAPDDATRGNVET